MEFSNLGKSDISVSRICYGSWQASGWATSDDSQFIKTVRRALTFGINFIDTAELYGNGHAESLIQKALQGIRQEVVIATKFSHKNASPPKVRLALENSLRRLNTDYIDLYQYHWPSPQIPLDETLQELQELKKEGKIRAIGVSNWMEPEWEECKLTECIDSLQPCYSLLWRSIERNVISHCTKHNISVLPYSPLCQGILAGKFQSLQQVPNDPRSHNVLLSEEKFPAVVKFLQTLRQVAEHKNRTTAQVSLRWLLQKDAVSSIIVGASNPEQISENSEIFDWQLEEEEVQLLNKMSFPISDDTKPHDTLWGWHSRK